MAKAKPKTNIGAKRGRKKGQPNKKTVWQKAFLEVLSECGCVTHAAKVANVSRTLVYAEKNRDPAFAIRWEEAHKLGTEGVEDEIRRRAYYGTAEPVFHKGEQVAEVTKYSDGLLLALARANNPAKWRENYKLQIEPPTDAVPQEAGGFYKAMLARMELRN